HHRVEIATQCLEAAAAQSIVAAELDDGDGGTVLRKERGEPRTTSGGRIAAAAGVDDAMWIVLGIEPLLQQRRPARARSSSVTRRTPVAASGAPRTAACAQ